MASHLSTIGISVKSKEEFHENFKKSYKNGEHIKTNKGTYTKWSMGNGVELWGQIDNKNTPIGLNPHFTGSAKMTVRITKHIVRPNNTVLDGAFYCWANPCEGNDNEVFPFVFDLPDKASYGKIKLPQVVTVQLAAFAHEIDVFENEETFNESQNTEIKFASESFIPSGLFSPNGTRKKTPEAHAIITGHIVDTREVINPITNLKFNWSKVRTLGGEFDVITDPEILKGKINK